MSFGLRRDARWGLRGEKAIFRPFVEHATPHYIARFLREVFASIDERPRVLDVGIDLSEAGDVAPLALELERGEPRLVQAGSRSATVRVGGRWLAEHDVPLAFTAPRLFFRLTPTTGGRVRVCRLRADPQFGIISKIKRWLKYED